MDNLTIYKNGNHKHAAQRIVDVQDIARRDAELERLRNENELLRAQLRSRMHYLRMAERAKRSAMLFVADRLAGRDVSQAAMNARHDMSRRAWEEARAALTAAGVADAWGVLMVTDARIVNAAMNALLEDIERAGNADAIIRHLPP